MPSECALLLPRSQGQNKMPEVKKRWAEASSDDDEVVAHKLPDSKSTECCAEKFVAAPSSFDSSVVLHEKRSYEDAWFDGEADPISLQVASRDCGSSSEAKFCLPWLNTVGDLLGASDVKILHRYIPSLPMESLQKVVTASHCERIRYLASKKAQSQDSNAEEHISKMCMRKVLATTFEQLASDDIHIAEVHRHWQATSAKGNRKGRNCAAEHRRKRCSRLL